MKAWLISLLAAVCLLAALPASGALDCATPDPSHPDLAAIDADVRALERTHAIDQARLERLVERWDRGERPVLHSIEALYCRALNADAGLDEPGRRQLYGAFLAGLSVSLEARKQGEGKRGAGRGDALPKAEPAPPVAAARPPAAKPAPDAKASKREADPFVPVRVFFATDRKATPGGSPGARFGGERGALGYGFCDVTIPLDHRIGRLESPRLSRLEFSEDPAKHVILHSVEVLDAPRFFAEVAARVKDGNASAAFVFVHGYNVSFADAARRTAQIAYDLKFPGAAVFYSWPSQGDAAKYTVDEANIEWSQANLEAFLGDFLARSSAEQVYLIAHSMGNRSLTRALAALLAKDPAAGRRLREVILTAPDIDAEVFRRDIAPGLAAAGAPVTLYASSVDRALLASQKIHRYPRAGESGTSLVIARGIETIDATEVDTSLVGHSYFAESSSVLSDIYYIVQGKLKASERFGLQEARNEAGVYWRFRRQ